MDTIEKCKKCKYRFICGGGCVFKANLNYGTINEENCSDFYEIIEEYLKYKLDGKNIYYNLLKLKFKTLKQLINNIKYIIIKAEGNSMLPYICSGEKVIVFFDILKLDIDDIVLYISKDTLKIHRIVSKAIDGSYNVKGDNDNYIEQIRKYDIIGKVVNNIEKNNYTAKIEKCFLNYRMIFDIKDNELINIGVYRDE